MVDEAVTESIEGRTISHYRVLRKLGAGGMGDVYLAQDTTLDRKVAIKFLSQSTADFEQARKRFEREAKAAAALDHPHICSVYEVGEEGGHSFIVMQYVEGETLASRIKGDPIEIREALDIAVQIVDALAKAHSRGIIHRDIKPQNVMLTASGQVKVLDFGLARVVREGSLLDSGTETAIALTSPGMIIGTVPYMSPEQVRGEELDGRSDIFSFGAMLYEMLSGRHPFQAESVGATISQILTKEPAPIARYAPEVSDELQRIVRKALCKKTDDRYQGIKDLLIDLRGVRQELDFEAKLSRKSATLVESEEGEEQELGKAPAAKSNSKERTQVAIASVVVVGLAVAIFLLWINRHAPGPELKSIAVLPFKPLVAENRDEALELGMADATITKLSNIKQIVVRSTSSILKYRDVELDPLAIGREQNVDLLLEGKVQRSGNNVRVTVQLVRVSDGLPLWADKFDEKFTDIFSLQDSISWRVAEALALKLSVEQKQQLAKRYTDNIEAYNLYLQGRFFWHKFNEDGLKKAIEYYKQAIALDPDYALAYTGLSSAYSVQGAIGIVPPAETWTEARRTAQKAVELDDSLPEAHTILGGVKLLYEWDWPVAEKELKRAIELNPNLADAHELYGFYFWVMGELDDALLEITRARDLSPISPVINFDLMTMFYYQGNYGEAINAYRKVQELDPNMVAAPMFIPGQIYERKGEYRRAVEECQAALSAFGRHPGVLSALGYVYGVSGNRRKAQEIITELEAMWKAHYFSPVLIALAHAGAGNKDQVFVWLAKAYESRDPQLIWLRVEPQFESLRPDPRFQALLRRMGISQ